MTKYFIENNFWNKTLLATGHHNVEISIIESGNNFKTGTPFIICIFENEKGYFPKKINLIMTSDQNRKFVNALFDAVGLDEPINIITAYKSLLNRKLSIFIGESFTSEFGKGVNINSFGKLKDKF